MKLQELILGVIFSIAIYGCQIFKINKSDKHGNRQGYWEHYWNDEGDIQRKGKYKHGLEVKKWKYYDLSGKLIKQEKYNKKRDVIDIKTYYENKKIKSNGQAFLINENDSILHFYWQGPWDYYSPNGELEKTEWYEKGKIKKAVTYP